MRFSREMFSIWCQFIVCHCWFYSDFMYKIRNVHKFVNKIIFDMQVQPWWRHVCLILYFCTKRLKAVFTIQTSAYPCFFSPLDFDMYLYQMNLKRRGVEICNKSAWFRESIRLSKVLSFWYCRFLSQRKHIPINEVHHTPRGRSSSKNTDRENE
jgi:hypothetical protein